MKPKLRRVLALVALILFVPFLVFFIMALGAYRLPYGLAPALASVFGLTILLLFLLIKMDDARRRKMTQAEEAILLNRLGVDGEGEDADSAPDASDAEEAGEPDDCASQADFDEESAADGRGAVKPQDGGDKE